MPVQLTHLLYKLHSPGRQPGQVPQQVLDPWEGEQIEEAPARLGRGDESVPEDGGNPSREALGQQEETVQAATLVVQLTGQEGVRGPVQGRKEILESGNIYSYQMSPSKVKNRLPESVK